MNYLNIQRKGDFKYGRVWARRKFKAIVHLVMLNREWLEEIEDEELGVNVLKNIRLLQSKLKAKKSVLTLKVRYLVSTQIFECFQYYSRSKKVF